MACHYVDGPSWGIFNRAIAALPEDIEAKETWKEAEVIHLVCTKLRHFPRPVLTHPLCKALGMTGNLLTAIPSDISLMRKLTVLDLRGNLLTDLPDELIEVPLTYLNISANRFAQFPLIIFALYKKTLIQFYIKANQILVFPHQIKNLENMSLDLSENPGCLLAAPKNNQEDYIEFKQCNLNSYYLRTQKL